MPSKVLLSVIIPTYHRNDLLANCLDCLHPAVQTLNPSFYEVIVTDDGRETTAQSLIEAHYPWVRWVKGPQKGPAANRNNGAKTATGEWLVFTDDDCLPDKDWLIAYFKIISTDATVNLLEGKTLADRPKERYDEEAPINENGGNLWSCNFSIHRSLFMLVKGFDEGFVYASMEDVDLFGRLKKANCKLAFVPNALIIHPFRSINASKLDKALWSFRYILIKHDQLDITYRIGRAKHLVKSLLVNTAVLAKFGFKGWPYYIKEHIFLTKLIFIS